MLPAFFAIDVQHPRGQFLGEQPSAFIFHLATMITVVRTSKFRHIYGSVRTKSGYDNVKAKSLRGDQSIMKASSDFVAVQWVTSG